jgi:ABC-type transporter Mla subunit MlaD
MNMNDEREAGDTAGRQERRIGSANPSELVEEVVGVTKNLGAAVGKEARAMAGRVTEQLSETAEAGVDRGADALGHFVRAMQAAGREIEPEAPGLARTLDDVASNVDGFAETIRGRSLSELASSAAELARRNPTIFLAGTIIAGFAVSRFVRSTAPASSEG